MFIGVIFVVVLVNAVVTQMHTLSVKLVAVKGEVFCTNVDNSFVVDE